VRLGVIGGRSVLVTPAGHAVDIARASGGDLPADPMALLDQWPAVREWAAGYDVEADSKHLIPAVDDFEAPVPRPRQVFAIALNYPPHAAEAGFTPPTDPLVFTKFPTCITGPRTTVALPDGHVDWEAELVAVIGRPVHRASRDRAWEAVAGLTVGQDLSERLTQSRGAPPQFSLGKSFPGFGPIGPLLVTPDEFADPGDLAITAVLNGETVQHDRTASMIFSVPELVERLSAIVPLLPGDLIFTGTPAGVGNRRTPPRYLAPGDELITRVEGIGELRQHFTHLQESS
jgi:2-keto-4-pentenoate hydratase/2-oxohepta-3-ene-1,7-dioic acid hydratase in catechol pathway